MPVWIGLGDGKEEDPMDTRIAYITARKVTRAKHKCHEFGCDRDCYGEYCAEHSASHSAGGRGSLAKDAHSLKEQEEER